DQVADDILRAHRVLNRHHAHNGERHAEIEDYRCENRHHDGSRNVHLRPHDFSPDETDGVVAAVIVNGVEGGRAQACPHCWRGTECTRGYHDVAEPAVD